MHVKFKINSFLPPEKLRMTFDFRKCEVIYYYKNCLGMKQLYSLLNYLTSVDGNDKSCMFLIVFFARMLLLKLHKVKQQRLNTNEIERRSG